MDQGSIQHITDISETLLIPLYARATETQSANPIIIDNKAVEITQEFNRIFETSDSALHKSLLKGTLSHRMKKKLTITLSLRTRKFDTYCHSFLQKNPNGIIVDLGCGLSTRFPRIDNGTLLWYDLDLPKVIDLRKQFFKETDRYHFIASSALDFRWAEQIKNQHKPVLFIAEGLFMYLHEDEVKNLVLTLQKTFPGCELACEVVNAYIVKMLRKKLFQHKFQRDFHLGKTASFYFGISESRELEQWNNGIIFLDDWTYFDENEKKLGWIKVFGRLQKFRYAQWIVHYRLQ